MSMALLLGRTRRKRRRRWRQQRRPTKRTTRGRQRLRTRSTARRDGPTSCNGAAPVEALRSAGLPVRPQRSSFHLHPTRLGPSCSLRLRALLLQQHRRCRPRPLPRPHRRRARPPRASISPQRHGWLSCGCGIRGLPSARWHRRLRPFEPRRFRTRAASCTRPLLLRRRIPLLMPSLHSSRRRATVKAALATLTTRTIWTTRRRTRARRWSSYTHTSSPLVGNAAGRHRQLRSRAQQSLQMTTTLRPHLYRRRPSALRAL